MKKSTSQYKSIFSTISFKIILSLLAIYEPIMFFIISKNNCSDCLFGWDYAMIIMLGTPILLIFLYLLWYKSIAKIPQNIKWIISIGFFVILISSVFLWWNYIYNPKIKVDVYELYDICNTFYNTKPKHPIWVSNYCECFMKEMRNSSATRTKEFAKDYLSAKTKCKINADFAERHFIESIKNDCLSNIPLIKNKNIKVKFCECIITFTKLQKINYPNDETLDNCSFYLK